MISLDRIALRRSTWVLLGLVALNIFYWSVYALAPALHTRWMRGEDHAIEWLTFIGFAGAGLVCLDLARRRAALWPRLWRLGLALFFIICAGEEISWGQRVFGYGTPESMVEENEQDEFNLHNLKLSYIHPVAIASWCIKSFGILGPLLLLLRRRGPDDPWRNFFPSPGVMPVFVAAELLTKIRQWLMPWLTATWGDATALVVKLDTVEFKEMTWGLSVLLGALALRDFYRRAEK